MGGIVLLVVLRGITFILDLLCLLTLSRIRAAGEVLACSCTPRLTPVGQFFAEEILRVMLFPYDRIVLALGVFNNTGTGMTDN